MQHLACCMAFIGYCVSQWSSLNECVAVHTIIPTAHAFINTGLFALVKAPSSHSVTHTAFISTSWVRDRWAQMCVCVCPHIHLLSGYEAQMDTHLMLDPGVKLQHGLKEPPA